MTRKFSSTSVSTTLNAGINSSATSIVVATGTGASLMGGVTLAAGNVDSFGIAIDVDTQNEEVVWVTQVSGDTLTIVRAKAGTSAIAHTAGATVKHVFTGDDATFFTTGTATADGAVPKSTVTAKGDLIVATASGVVARQAVGTNDYVLTADSTQTNGIKWAPAATTSLNITFNAQTGTTYTLVSGDVNKLVTLNNASAVTVTVPNGVFTTGQQVNLQQIGVGQVTIASDGTTTITSTPGLKLNARYSAATLICTGTNTFTLVGSLSA